MDRKTIAVMIDAEWPVRRHIGVLNGVKQYARDRTNWKLLCDLYPQHRLERYDAVIGRLTEDLAVRAVPAGIPLVNTWANSPVVDRIPSVIPDLGGAAEMAAEHLLARGFEHFGLVGFKSGTARIARKIFEGSIREARRQCSTLFLPYNYNESPARWAHFSRRLETWVDSWEKPIGVYCTNDLIAMHLVTVCQFKKIAIPLEAALLGTYNETMYCERDEPSLSSIDMGCRSLGYRAAEILDDVLQGRPPPSETIVLPPEFLIPRQSTDAYVVEDPLMAAALRFISENSHEPISVEDVAQGVNSTRRSLERRFRAHGGRTIAQEIVHFRVERLKRLLVQTNKPVKYLAHEVGFKDAVQMSAVFRRVEGSTPSTYRRLHRVRA